MLFTCVYLLSVFILLWFACYLYLTRSSVCNYSHIFLCFSCYTVVCPVCISHHLCSWLGTNFCLIPYIYHHHHVSVMELGHLLTHSSLTYPEVSPKVCPASFRETCQWLKFPLNGLRAQSRVSPVVGSLPLASGQACLGMAFPPFLMKQLYRCDSGVISLFVRTGCTMRRWRWLLGRIGYSITPHYPLYPAPYLYILHNVLLFDMFCILLIVFIVDLWNIK